MPFRSYWSALLAFAPASLLAAASALPAAAQVLVAVDSASAAPGALVSVPVVVRGAASSPARKDPLQALSLKVVLEPARLVESARVRRAGVLAEPKPFFEAVPSAAGMAGLVVSFDEKGARIPFGTGAERKGDLVAVVEVRLSKQAAPGDVVRLVLDPVATLLSNRAGTSAVRVRDGTLSLLPGAISVAKEARALRLDPGTER